VEDLEAFADMIGRDHAGADMLPRCGDAGIERVDVEIVPGDHVARHHRALVEVDMLAAIDDAPGIIEVDQQRLAIGAGGRLDNMDGGTGSAEMDLVAPWLEIVLRVSPAQRKPPGGACDRVLDEPAGDAQPSILANHAAARRHGLDAGGDGIGEADRFEELERRRVDLLHVAARQQLVPAAFHAGSDCCFLGGDRPRPECPARLAAAAPAR
jgi:hypothetical protein